MQRALFGADVGSSIATLRAEAREPKDHHPPQAQVDPSRESRSSSQGLLPMSANNLSADAAGAVVSCLNLFDSFSAMAYLDGSCR
jgi:hypothetical protein